MPVYPGSDTVDYAASDPQAYVKGAAGVNALAQNFAQRQAGQQIAAGDATGGANTLYNAGDIPGGQAVATNHQGVLDAHAAKDRQAHTDALKFINDTATALDQVRLHQGNDAVLAAFDRMAPLFAQREGASAAAIAQIRQGLQDHPDTFLEAMATHAQHQMQVLHPGDQGFDETGHQLAAVPLAPTYHTVGADQTLVRDDPNAPAGGGNATGGAPALAPQPGAPSSQAAAPDAPPPPPTPPLTSIANAILSQESGHNPNIHNSVDGAHGIGQLMPGTFKLYARPGERIDNPTDNLNVANRLLEHYTQAYNGDPARVAVAYFSGPGNVAPENSPTPWVRDTHDGNGVHTSAYVQQVLGRIGGTPTAAEAAPAAASPVASSATVIAHGPPKAPPPAQPFTLGPGATRYDASGKPIVTAPAKPAGAKPGDGKLPTQDAARLKAMDAMVDNAEVLNNMAQDWIHQAHGVHTGWWYNTIGGHTAQGGGSSGGIRPGQVINALVDPDTRSAIQNLDAISNRATPMLRPTGSGRILGAEYTNFANAFPNTRNDPVGNMRIANEYQQQLATAHAKVVFFHQWASEHGGLDGADEAWYQHQAAPNSASAAPSGRRRVWSPEHGVQ